MPDPTERAEAMELLQIARKLPAAAREIYIAIGDLLSQNRDAALLLSDVLLLWLNLKPMQRLGVKGLLESIVRESRAANDILKG